MADTILITAVRIRNFRSLENVEISLEPTTLLIGENNAGKTSFLDALYIALGSENLSMGQEDIYLATNESRPPVERAISIDVRVQPYSVKDAITLDSFEESLWRASFRDAIIEDDHNQEMFVIRTEMRWDDDRNGYVTERYFLNRWESESRINDFPLTAERLEAITLFVLDAKRDIQDDLSNKRSFWHRLVTNHGMTDEQVTELEQNLGLLNRDIIDKSPVLTHVQGELGSFYRVVSSDRESVFITPLVRHLRDLNRGMDINFRTKDAQLFPLSRHGMGTRSLASVLTFRAYSTWRLKHSAETTPVHPFVAIEEPETHLHPQAQRAVFRQIHEIPGQKIVSTHSPYLAAQAPILSFRYFRKDGTSTKVTQMDPRNLRKDDERKIEQMILETRGDLLYSRALVLCEGPTEQDALPQYASRYWGMNPNDLGISFIGIGGAGNYSLFLKMADSFGIPWFVFADAEKKPIERLVAGLGVIGVSDYQSDNRVITLTEGQNYEIYLVDQGYENEIVRVTDRDKKYDPDEDGHYLDEYIRIHDGKLKKGKIQRVYQSEGGRERAMIDLLSEGKTVYAKPLAEEIANLPDPARRFPEKIRELFDKISSDLGLQREEFDRE